MMGRSVLLLALAGCVSAAADHERLGDAALAKDDFVTAAAEYRAGVQANARPSVLAKLALTSVHLKNYREAAEVYRRLGEVDPSRAGEAATGLDRVAQAAERAGDAVAIHEALVGLRALAPDRPAGRLAVSVAMAGQLAPVEAMDLLPYALAGARDETTVDSMLLLYGGALRETTACEDAARVYRAVLRRNPDAPPATAKEGFATCAIRLGQDAGDLNEPAIAERWYRQAWRADSSSVLGRHALLGLADARLAQDDSVEAMDLYQSVMQGSPSDSLGAQAAARLLSLGVGASRAQPNNLEPR